MRIPRPTIQPPQKPEDRNCFSCDMGQCKGCVRVTAKCKCFRDFPNNHPAPTT